MIGIHAGKYYQRNDGLALGPGCFVKGLEYSAECQAVLVGKPNLGFFRSALGDTDPEEAVMIGDVSSLINIQMRYICIKYTEVLASVTFQCQ